MGQERNGARAVRRLGGRGNNANGNGEEGEGREMERGPGMLRRNAENVAARLERLEAHVEQMFDVLDDADGAEDVPFDELVGMQGPVFHLVENAITVCLVCYLWFLVGSVKESPSFVMNLLYDTPV